MLSFKAALRGSREKKPLSGLCQMDACCTFRKLPRKMEPEGVVTTTSAGLLAIHQRLKFNKKRESTRVNCSTFNAMVTDSRSMRRERTTNFCEVQRVQKRPRRQSYNANQNRNYGMQVFVFLSLPPDSSELIQFALRFC